jgi:hypothetical protein
LRYKLITSELLPPATTLSLIYVLRELFSTSHPCVVAFFSVVDFFLIKHQESDKVIELLKKNSILAYTITKNMDIVERRKVSIERNENSTINPQYKTPLTPQVIFFTIVCSITAIDYISKGSNFLAPHLKAFANESLARHYGERFGGGTQAWVR